MTRKMSNIVSIDRCLSCHCRSVMMLFISHRTINYECTHQDVISSMTTDSGKQMDSLWVIDLYLCVSLVNVHVAGWTRNKSCWNTVFVNTSDNICWWFSCIAQSHQLELCICQHGFHEKQDHLLDAHRLRHSLHHSLDLCKIQRSQRSWESKFFLTVDSNAESDRSS